jgi:hypothetical protein
MHIGRAIIIPAIIALGAAGSIMSSSAMSAATAHAPVVHAQAVGASPIPNIYYHT